jgi:hypothetical protein
VEAGTVGDGRLDRWRNIDMECKSHLQEAPQGLHPMWFCSKSYGTTHPDTGFSQLSDGRYDNRSPLYRSAQCLKLLRRLGSGSSYH